LADMSRRAYIGPEGKAGWKEEFSWKDKKGVWRKRTIYGTGTIKLDVDSAGALERSDPSDRGPPGGHGHPRYEVPRRRRYPR